MKKFKKFFTQKSSSASNRIERSISNSVQRLIPNPFGNENMEWNGNKLRDDRLIDLLKQLKLMEYQKNFEGYKVVYEDLPDLEPDEIEELIPDRIPRKRFVRHLKKLFSVDKKEGWLLDKDNLKLDESPGDSSRKITVGNYVNSEGVKTSMIVCEFDCKKNNVKVENSLNDIQSLTKLMGVKNVVVCHGAVIPKDSEETKHIIQVCFEHYPKGSLEIFLQQQKDKKLSVLKKCEIFLQISIGLSNLYRKGFCNGNLNTKNILVHEDGSFRISGYYSSIGGVHKVVGSIEEDVEDDSLDTWPYRSPEHELWSKDKKVDIKKKQLSDVWSFGMIMWRVLVNKIPFEDLLEKHGSSKNVLKLVHGKDKVRPSVEEECLKGKGVEEDILDLMIGCWDANTEDRPPNFEFLVEEFKYYIEELKGKKKELYNLF